MSTKSVGSFGSLGHPSAQPTKQEVGLHVAKVQNQQQHIANTNTQADYHENKGKEAFDRAKQASGRANTAQQGENACDAKQARIEALKQLALQKKQAKSST